MAAPSILFIHDNFPAQFRSLAGYLQNRGWDVHAAGENKIFDTKKFQKFTDGVRVLGYRRPREPSQQTHRYLRGLEKAVLTGQGFAGQAIRMANSNINPDIIVAHSGWGSGSFAKAVWPDAVFVQYLEWWYAHPPRDINPPYKKLSPAEEANARAQTHARNLPFMLDAMQADAILIPTRFQALDVPKVLRKNIHILHDGVDCDFFHPEIERAEFTIGQTKFDPKTRFLTYATRGMEPTRGFPEFMAAASRVMKENPDIHCAIAGNDSVHYGGKLPEGDSYLKRALAEHDFDKKRLHLLGRLSLQDYAKLLRRSDCHVYLTKPFVLSWSLIESMASAAPLVVSDTPPLVEALPHDSQALRVTHTDIDALTAAIHKTLNNPKDARKRGGRARARAENIYAASKLLPKHEELFQSLIDARTDLQDSAD
ncbi:MAG: glycosyltransferase [Planktomarina sp.]